MLLLLAQGASETKVSQGPGFQRLSVRTIETSQLVESGLSSVQFWAKASASAPREIRLRRQCPRASSGSAFRQTVCFGRLSGAEKPGGLPVLGP